MKLPLLLLLLSASACRMAFAADPDPREQLPPHITRLTWFGERADWRHDGKRFVFLNRAYGDVYEYEFASKRITPCTSCACNAANASRCWMARATSFFAKCRRWNGILSDWR